MNPIRGISKPKQRQQPLADDSGLREKAPAGTRQRAAKAPAKRWRRFVFNGTRPEPLPSYLGSVEPAVKGKLGVCCSGGGIRSAAFSLGALQVLQEKGELRKASYLAAVSGGSYIAAAISMVAKTGDRDSDLDLIKDLPPFAPGSPEEQYLRNRCSYLAPTLTDKLYLGMRVVLGLLVNLVFLSLPLVGFALILTGLLYAPLLPDLAGSSILVVDYQANLPTWFWAAPLATLGLSALAGLGTLLFRWREEEWERFFAAWATRLLIAAVILALFLVGLPYLVEWLRDLSSSGNSANSLVHASVPKLGAGTLALLAGVAAQLGHLLKSKSARADAERARKAFAKLGSAARLTVAYAAGALVGPLLLVIVVGLAVAAGMSEAARDGTGSVDWGLAAIGAGVLVIFGFLYHFADLTTWSLHPFYKRRLSSAFALKRVREKDLDEEERKRLQVLKPANLASDAGVAVERDFDELVPISETALDEATGDGEWPTLLVCAAANISDTAATPPGRSVTSFTFSAHTVGGPLVGAVGMAELEQAFESRKEAEKTADSRSISGQDVKEMVTELVNAGARKHRRRDLTLPSAVAMSGAAISPSMGKMTSRPLTFLMALANLRLGVWVPNPRWVAGSEDEHLPRLLARPRPSYLLRELLGLNSVSAKYLYVTDGGHYENLGLVELLRRGCTEVYCLDASGVGSNGVEFETLGEAIALARSELNVEIEFDTETEGEDPSELTPDEATHLAKRDVVTATIRYPKGPEGKLIYVRNTMTAKAPWDVRAHHEDDPRFPNNPTVDQLYTDQKFEAYRVLGARAGADAFAALRGT